MAKQCKQFILIHNIANTNTQGYVDIRTYVLWAFFFRPATVQKQAQAATVQRTKEHYNNLDQTLQL